MVSGEASIRQCRIRRHLCLAEHIHNDGVRELFEYLFFPAARVRPGAGHGHEHRPAVVTVDIRVIEDHFPLGRHEEHHHGPLAGNGLKHLGRVEMDAFPEDETDEPGHGPDDEELVVGHMEERHVHEYGKAAGDPAKKRADRFACGLGQQCRCITRDERADLGKPHKSVKGRFEPRFVDEAGDYPAEVHLFVTGKPADQVAEERFCEVPEVGVGEHDPLGHPGGAARVADGAYVFFCGACRGFYGRV